MATQNQSTKARIEEILDFAPQRFKQLTFNEITTVGAGLRTVGGWFVNPKGLLYYKGSAYIKIETSPKLRILVNDGENDRILIGEE